MLKNIVRLTAAAATLITGVVLIAVLSPSSSASATVNFIVSK